MSTNAPTRGAAGTRAAESATEEEKAAARAEAARIAALPSRSERLRHRAIGGLLIALMAVGSVVMWIGSPVALLWLASELKGSNGRAEIGLYVLVFLTLPVVVFILARGLLALDRMFVRVTGWDTREHKTHLPWLTSIGADRRPQHRRRAVLDVVMVMSVVVAVAAFGIYFLLFAHPGLPSG